MAEGQKEEQRSEGGAEDGVHQTDARNDHVDGERISGDVAEGPDGQSTLASKDVPPRSSSKPGLSLETDGPHKPEHLDHHPADDLHGPDSPTTTLIESLRTQLALLSEQSVQLNTKLIASISRHADLEDQHFALQEQHKALGDRAEGLERDKKQWEESMNTGLLVERSQISAEMQKLAAGLVEEERKRGSAEERRKQVEMEVDDLSASLFDQANTMVAQERHGRIEAEERLKSAEENLAVAEAAVRDMQVHLQSMPSTSRSPPMAPPAPTGICRKYLASHVPYFEYLGFLAHLRSLRPLRETSKNLFPPPFTVNLLAQPFLARISAEDHDPTLRLDIAPDISWLSRKGVNQAIIAGELIIEPVAASTVIAGSSNAVHDIGCSLCGKPVFPATLPPSSPIASHFGPPPQHPSQQRSASSSRFSLKPFFNSTSPNPTTYGTSPTSSPLASPGPTLNAMVSLGSVYIFRVNKPLPASGAAQEKEARLYPICKTGWCLERLRATCELWHFVRTGIVHVVWHGDDGYVFSSESAGGGAGAAGDNSGAPNGQASHEGRATPTGPDADVSVPEMNRKKSSAWGLGFKLADKAPSGWAKAWNRSSSSAGSTPLPTMASQSPPVSPRRLPPKPEERTMSGSSVTTEEPEEVAEADPKVSMESAGETPGVVENVTREKVENGTTEESKEAKEAPADLETKKDEKDVNEDVVEKPPPAEEEDDLLASLQAQLEASSPPRPKPKKLGDPLELEGQTGDVPEITEIAATPQTTTAGEIENPLEVSTLARNESSGSIATDNSDEFKTPKEEQRELQDSAVLEPKGEEEGTPKKPPIPKRSAGRMTPRPNSTGGGTPEIGSRSASPAPPASPSAPTLPPRRATGVDDPITAAAVDPDGEDGGEKADQPPLPPRHPKTPNAQITFAQTIAADGEKAWIKDDDESWEVKTWKQVIRLKEEMWRRRIGVVDGGKE